jgi:hypothetical protein
MTAPDTAPATPARMSFGAKFIGIFTNPRRVFESLSGGHEWIILWLIVSAVAIAGYLPIKDVIKTTQIQKVQEQLDSNPQVSAEQKQQILDRMESQFSNPLWTLLTPVFMLIAMAVVAAVLLFIANIILGGNTRYLTVLNAYAWTMMIVVPATIVTVPLVMAKGSMDVTLGLGVLTSADTGAFLKKFLTLFEVFGLWQVWLSSVAVAVLGKSSAGKAFAAVFVAWLVWVLIQGGLATMGVNFGA